MISNQTYDTILSMIKEEGVQESVDILAEVLSQYADELSDDGLKEKANEAIEMAGELSIILTKLNSR